MRPILASLVALLAAPLVLGACSSTYHPEYHPVTVSTFSQNLAYPVSVNNAGSAAERAPVYIVPAAPPPAPPPAGFFAPE